MMPDNPNQGDKYLEETEAAANIIVGFLQDLFKGKPQYRPVFRNLSETLIVGEINSFLGQEKKTRIAVPTNSLMETYRYQAEQQSSGAFRDSPPEPAEEQEIIDEEFEEAFKRAIVERRAELIAAIRTGAVYNWVYTLDGILAIGSGGQTKHSVLAGGAKLWAAGTVQLKKTDKADEAVGGYKELYRQWQYAISKEMEPEDIKVPKDLMDKELAEYRKVWEERGYLKGEKIVKEPSFDTAEESGRTTIWVDFDSGHYSPKGAWDSTYEAWEGLGFTVEKLPGSQWLT